MMALSHFRSKNLLKYKMERSGGRVVECSEEYTSKTCSRCGNVKYDLGASAIYKCNSCRLTQDRDINAGKNILIKNVSRLLGSASEGIGEPAPRRPASYVLATEAQKYRRHDDDFYVLT